MITVHEWVLILPKKIYTNYDIKYTFSSSYQYSIGKNDTL